MKIELKTYKKTYSVETEYDDISLDEYFQIFEGLLVQAGFNKQSIEEYIVELGQQINEENNQETLKNAVFTTQIDYNEQFENNN